MKLILFYFLNSRLSDIRAVQWSWSHWLRLNPPTNPIPTTWLAKRVAAKGSAPSNWTVIPCLAAFPVWVSNVLKRRKSKNLSSCVSRFASTLFKVSNDELFTYLVSQRGYQIGNTKIDLGRDSPVLEIES